MAERERYSGAFKAKVVRQARIGEGSL